MPEVFEKSAGRDKVLRVLALCTALFGAGCEEEIPEKEAIMPIVQDGGASNCPVDIECALGKNFRTGLQDCIDFSRCDPPVVK